jgi:hypothetical protein
MPVELAVSLSALALYDIVIYADDSGSMTTGDGERIEDLKLIVAKVAEVATLFDEDGIAVSPQLHQLVSLDGCRLLDLGSYRHMNFSLQHAARMGPKEALVC